LQSTFHKNTTGSSPMVTLGGQIHEALCDTIFKINEEFG